MSARFNHRSDDQIDLGLCCSDNSSAVYEKHEKNKHINIKQNYVSFSMWQFEHAAFKLAL